MAPDTAREHSSPRRALLAIELAPGETRRVTLALDARAFAYFDVASQRFHAEAGKYGIELARSADDVQARAELVLPRPIALDVKD